MVTHKTKKRRNGVKYLGTFRPQLLICSGSFASFLYLCTVSLMRTGTKRAGHSTIEMAR
jgi:hypothetical protein